MSNKTGFVFLPSTFLLSFVLAFCWPPPTFSSAPTGVQTLTDLADLADTNRNATVKIGDTFYLKFTQHPSVGLTVTVKSRHPDIVVIADNKIRNLNPEKMREGMTGGDMAESIYYFRALQPGLAEIEIDNRFRDTSEHKEIYTVTVEDANTEAEILIVTADIKSISFDQRPGSSGHLTISLSHERLDSITAEVINRINQTTALIIEGVGAINVEPKLEGEYLSKTSEPYALFILNNKLEVIASMTPEYAGPDLYEPLIEIVEKLNRSKSKSDSDAEVK